MAVGLLSVLRDKTPFSSRQDQIEVDTFQERHANETTPRMGQQHVSPGQSAATKRRVAPPWVTEKRSIVALKGQYDRCSDDDLFVWPLQGNGFVRLYEPRAALRSALG